MARILGGRDRGQPTFRAVRVIGAEEAAAWLGEMAVKMQNMQLAQPMVNQLLAIHFNRKWQEWNGYLYETGRLQRSWTSPHGGGDAIRRAHSQEIEYGSSVPYGRFYQGQILSDVDHYGGFNIANAMADYYAGVRAVAGYQRGGSWVRPYLRQAHG